jgi:Na+(H+)/acetate symporter ActP
MSTVGTQLNWGCSYLVNDLYKRFLVRNSTEQHYVRVSRVITVLLVLASGYTAAQLKSIGAGWELVLGVGFGTGAVYILRWYWWRISAWSEISAMLAAAVVTIGLRNVSFEGNDALVYAKKTLITGGLTTVAWLVVTFLTRAESNATLVAFYRRVHPTVYGWKRIAKLAPELPEVKDVAGNAFNWLMGVILVYGCLFGIGKLVFQQWGQGILLLALAAVAGYLIFWDLSRRGWETLSGKVVDSTPQATSAD